MLDKKMVDKLNREYFGGKLEYAIAYSITDKVYRVCFKETVKTPSEVLTDFKVLETYLEALCDVGTITWEQRENLFYDVDSPSCYILTRLAS